MHPSHDHPITITDHEVDSFGGKFAAFYAGLTPPEQALVRLLVPPPSPPARLAAASDTDAPPHLAFQGGAVVLSAEVLARFRTMYGQVTAPAPATT